MQALQEAGLSQSGLARMSDVDRSTISQLLKGQDARMPNAQLVGSMSTALGVSADWLLSLSDRPESAADLMASSLSLSDAPRALIDEQIFAWHQEAAGYKIRHVPAALPDMLKTSEMLVWEYTPHLGRTTQQAVGASNDRLEWLRTSSSDYEIALPLHELESFSRATGYYRGLPAEIRIAQLERLLNLTEQVYPRLRIYMFDARRLFSAPITVFGPLLSVLYVGRHYVAFRDKERISAFTDHFDGLVRDAAVSARDLPNHLRQLKELVR